MFRTMDLYTCIEISDLTKCRWNLTLTPTLGSFVVTCHTLQHLTMSRGCTLAVVDPQSSGTQICCHSVASESIITVTRHPAKVKAGRCQYGISGELPCLHTVPNHGIRRARFYRQAFLPGFSGEQKCLIPIVTADLCYRKKVSHGRLEPSVEVK